MKPKRDIASFVLRFTQDIWQDEQGEPRVEWRGHVRHVQDGKELHFKDVAQAVQFFQEVLLQRTNDCLKADDVIDREKAMAESNKLWERFAATYSGMFADAVDSALRPVRWVTGLVTGREAEESNLEANETERLLASIRSLEQQLQVLNAKLNAIPTAPTDNPLRPPIPATHTEVINSL